MKILGIGELLLRFSPDKGNSILDANQLNTYYGGGEFNTCAYLSSFGHEVSYATTLPKSLLGQRGLIEIKKYGMNTSYINIEGDKLGSYYVEPGNDYKAASVIYDRAHSAFSYSNKSSFPISEMLEDIELLHISGITPALSSGCLELSTEIIKLANSRGIKVSYDSNFRGKLWTQEQAGEFLKSIMHLLDYVFISILDIKYLLGYDVEGLSLEECYKMVLKDYPNIKIMASTTRVVVNSNVNKLSSNIFDGELYSSEIFNINIIDRVGGGDAFTAGVLEGILTGLEPVDIANFSSGCAVLKHYQPGDNYHCNKEDIINFVNKNSMEINR